VDTKRFFDKLRAFSTLQAVHVNYFSSRNRGGENRKTQFSGWRYRYAYTVLCG